MERSEIIKRCVAFYQMMTLRHDNLVLLFVLCSLCCLSSNDGRQGAASHSKASAASARHSAKKRKRNDILERMAEYVQFSIAAQEKDVQVLVDAISGVNERFKIGEKLEQLGFSDDEVVQVVLKFSDNPLLEKSFWGLTDSQKSLFIRTILR